jgi:predicted ATPase
MEKQLFVGREEQLALCIRILAKAAQGEVSLVFIEGEAGMGKSEFLAVVQALQESELKKSRFAFGYCYEDIGAQDAFYPLLEIIGSLRHSPRNKSGVTALALSLINEAGPDLVQIIPGVGPAVTAGVKAAAITGQWLFGTRQDQLMTARTLAAQYSNIISKIASRHRPLILVIEDAHWIDEASCDLLARLLPRIGKQSLAFILSYRPSHLNEAHPLKRVQRQAQAQNVAQTILLEGLTETQVQRYLEARFGNSPTTQFPAWLVHLCNGNPLFVSQYLTLLEDSKIITLEKNSYSLKGRIERTAGDWHLSLNIPVPSSIEAVLEQRIQRLIEDDRKMLQSASVQGQDFVSSILSRLLQVDEIEILPRLRTLVENHRVIRYGAEAEPVLAQEADVYSFEHVLMHRVFYKKLSPRERVLYHQRIAQILELAIKADANPQRKIIIEIARHYHLGNTPLLAANYYYFAACSTFAIGALKETAELCRLALEQVRSTYLSPQDKDVLHVGIILLFLSATEMRWHKDTESQNELSLTKLVEEGFALALRHGADSLVAQLQFMQGKILLANASLPEAVAAMEKALEIARSTNNKVAEFEILSHLANLIKVEELDEGIELSYQAHRLYKEHIEPFHTPSNQTEITRHYHRLQGFIGVGEFDRGNYDEAIKWIQSSISGFKQQKMQDDLLRAFNYLGQAFIVTGLFERAEAILKESVDFLKEDDTPHPWRGYNYALLGKLYIEWQRCEEAARYIMHGLKETEAARQVDLGRHVTAYYIELLMQTDCDVGDLSEARRQLELQLAAANDSGFHDAQISALSRMAQLELYVGNTALAVEYSAQAVQHLEKLNMKVPVIRAEEILFNHYRVLGSLVEHASEALSYLEKADAILQQKAYTLKDEGHRRLFLERVPISRAIASALLTLQPVAS